MICVYTPDCTDFSGNGIGPVSPLSCTVTETLNGEWELTLEHPLDDAGKWRRLVEGCILRAPVPAAMTPGITMVTQATPEVKREVWKVRTNGSRLMLRSGTGTKYKIIGKYKNGTEVVLMEKTTSSWYKMLTPDGKQGYMSTDWLKWWNPASCATSRSASIGSCQNLTKSPCMPVMCSMTSWTT